VSKQVGNTVAPHKRWRLERGQAVASEPGLNLQRLAMVAC
jgi:hypothetical protein